MLRKKILTSLLGLSLLLGSAASSFANDIKVTRISGRDRYETATKVNQMYFNKAFGNLAIISSGEDFRTALYGSYMANALKVPFYIISSDVLSEHITNEFRRLDIKKVYVIGSSDTIDEEVDNSLKNMDITVERYETQGSTATVLPDFGYEFISSKYPAFSIDGADYFAVVNDKKFPDLLSSIPFLSTLLREKSILTCDYMDFSKYGEYEGYSYIVGGFNSVPSSITTIADKPIGLTRRIGRTMEDGRGIYYYSGRIAGKDRYETAAKVAEAYSVVFDKKVSTVVLVDGTKYPDALASGTVATQNNGVVLLTQPNKLNSHTKNYIKTNNIKNVIVVGGKNSVSNKVIDELNNL